MYPLLSFVAEFGGAVGLYLGASLIRYYYIKTLGGGRSLPRPLSYQVLLYYHVRKRVSL